MTEEQTIVENSVDVTIDGKSVRVPQGSLILDAATAAGIHIPIYCSHPKMDPVAVCRMCLVEVDKTPKMQPACATTVAEGMVVHTATDSVAKMREGVLEFLLLNHPLDCPVCDRGGECDLQDFAFRYGPQTSRFPITDKNHFNKAVVLSEKIELDQERCILCWRCTRFYDEITGEKELVLQQRGSHTVIDTFNGQSLTSPFQGNLPEVCPVGALTHRQYRFKARPWDLQRTKSVCPECSYGCNINIDSREYAVKRFASRDNPLVDDMWLCDQGRYSAEQWNGTSRVRTAVTRVGGVEKVVDATEAITVAAQELLRVKAEHGAGAIGVLASPMSTNEELWLIQRLAREVIETPHIDHQLVAMKDLDPDEHALGIAQIEECSAVIVVGSAPEEQAPVLTLRLRKAATKCGVVIHRVAKDIDVVSAAAMVKGDRFVGVIADETDRDHARSLATAVRRVAQDVAQLTITRAVNGRGAKDMGVLPTHGPGYRPVEAEGMNGLSLLEAATRGELHALILVNAQALFDEVPDQLTKALRAVDVVVAIETTPGAIASLATVVVPGHAYVEKLGTVTNVEGRIQRIRPALPPAVASTSELRVLSLLAKAMGAKEWPTGTESAVVHTDICNALPEYARAGVGERAQWRTKKR